MKNYVLTISVFFLLQAISVNAQKRLGEEEVELKVDNGIYTYYKEGDKKPFTGILQQYDYNDSGKKVVTREENIVKGKGGSWKTFYLNGTIHEDGTCNKPGDNKYGYIEYWDGGLLKSKGEYIGTEKNGQWSYYTMQGNFDYGGNYILDKMDGQWIYKDSIGNIFKELAYGNSFIMDIIKQPGTISDTTGLIYEKGTAKPLTGYYTEYYLPESDSLIYKKAHYVKGRMVGEYKEYSKEQKVIEEFSYDENSQKNGEYRMYYPNGQVEITGNYFNNNKMGYWTFFDKEGNRLEDIIYSNNGEIFTTFEYEKKVK